MAGNEALVGTIVERLRPFLADAEAPGALDTIETQLTLLDSMGGPEVSNALGEMLLSVDRAIAGLEDGNTDAAVEEADRWGLGHLLREALARQNEEHERSTRKKKD